MVQEISRAGGWIEAVLCCPHLPDDGCHCRKPALGLLKRAQEELALDLAHAAQLILNGNILSSNEQLVLQGALQCSEFGHLVR
jgi:hypothetical protein